MRSVLAKWHRQWRPQYLTRGGRN